jgi:spore coat polysaccharide biosynthesis predicted glycosyltransferase SpsG
MTRVLVRVAAAAAVGLGPLARCAPLAQAGRHAGLASRFLPAGEPATLARAGAAGFPTDANGVAAAWTDEDLRATITAARAADCESIVVDSDRAGEVYLVGLRRAGFFVTAIDDLAAHPCPCQLVVNNDADAESLAYVSSSGDTRFLLGPRYALLGPDFPDVLADHDDPPGPRTVLIVLGGADHLGLTPRLVAGLAALPAIERVIAVVGPFATNLAAVEAAAAAAPRPVRVVHAPTAMAPLLAEATIAVSAAGQTLYRLARVGCPTVAVQAAANQRGQLTAMAQAGALNAVRCGADGDVTLIVATAARLLADAGTRRRMRAAGRTLVDGRGAARVAEAMTAAIGRTVEAR